MSFTDGDVVRLLLYVIGSGCAFAGALFGLGIRIVLGNERAKHKAVIERFDKQDEHNEKMWTALQGELRVLDRRMTRVETKLELPDIQRRAGDPPLGE